MSVNEGGGVPVQRDWHDAPMPFELVEASVDRLVDDVPRRSFIPQTAFVRPVIEIPPAASDNDFSKSVSDLYHPLTMQLPLMGGPALKPNAGGIPQLIVRLRDEAPWLEPALQLLEGQLRVQLWAGRPWTSFKPLLLVGPPGCGKSSFARLLATASGCAHATLDLGGVSDSRALEGTARGWTGAQPCFPAMIMMQGRTANPIITLEEVDKAGGSERGGDPLAVLLTMIERSTAATYYDKCLMADVDLSHVCWVLTANDVCKLSTMLLSRLDVVQVEAPGPEHFDGLLAVVLRDLAVQWDLPVTALPNFTNCVAAGMRKVFNRHRSVRQLARMAESVIAAGLRPDMRLLQ